MAAIQLRSLLHAPSPSASRHGRFHASLHAPINLGNPRLSLRKTPALLNVQELIVGEEKKTAHTSTTAPGMEGGDVVVSKLYAIMEAAVDRAHMHDIIGEQRNNWNLLLHNSLNSITLTASVAAGLSALPLGDATPHHVVGVKTDFSPSA